MHRRSDNSDPCASTHAIISVGNQTFTPQSLKRAECSCAQSALFLSERARSEFSGTEVWFTQTVREKKSKKIKIKSQFLITLHHLSENTPSCLLYHVRCCTHKGFSVSVGMPVLFTPCLPLCGKGLPLYSEVMPISLSVISNRLNTKSSGQNKIFGVNRSLLFVWHLLFQICIKV